MTAWVIPCCYVMIILGLVCGFYRFIIGPNTLNRILAFDYLAACVIALIVLYCIQNRNDDYLEVILIFCLLGFATVITFMEVFFYKLGNNKHE